MHQNFVYTFIFRKTEKNIFSGEKKSCSSSSTDSSGNTTSSEEIPLNTITHVASGEKEGKCEIAKSRNVSQVISPEYTIYRDKDIDIASKAGSIPDELVHRLIRGTIHNMKAIAYDTCKRLPNTQELVEMSKSIVLMYPSLKDPETSHVCDIQFIFSSLF